MPQTHSATAADPGSDDLTFTWSFGVTQTVTNPTGTFPFTATRQASATFTTPGAVTISVAVTDEDLGVGAASLPKLVIFTETCTRGLGFWRQQYAPRGQKRYTPAQLSWFLSSVNSVSSIFSEQVAANTTTQAFAVLSTTGTQRGLATAHLLAAWLNFAAGGIGVNELLDTDWDLVPDTPFLTAMVDAETILRNPAATNAELERAKELAEAVNLHDVNNPECL